jgi:hypothetical protein
MDAAADSLWPLSVTATLLAWIGYVPEFHRLWVERRASGVGAWMWAVWIVSSALSTAYAFLMRAPLLASLNIAVICCLTIAVAAGNLVVHCCVSRAELPWREDGHCVSHNQEVESHHQGRRGALDKEGGRVLGCSATLATCGTCA